MSPSTQCKKEFEFLICLVNFFLFSFVKVDKEVCVEFGLSWNEVIDIMKRVVERLKGDVVKVLLCFFFFFDLI
jgi:hypothetical protein